MTTPTRQPGLTALYRLQRGNAALPQLALDAACRGNLDLARAYLKVARQRGIECDVIAAQIERTAEQGVD